MVTVRDTRGIESVSVALCEEDAGKRDIVSRTVTLFDALTVADPVAVMLRVCVVVCVFEISKVKVLLAC